MAVGDDDGMGRRRRLRILHLLTSLVQSPERLRSVDDLCDLVGTLRALLVEQHEHEKSAPTKTPYLQARRRRRRRTGREGRS